MQTGYFVHKVLVTCKLPQRTWSCYLLPSGKCTWKTWDCWGTPFQARHVPQLPTPGGLVSPDQNIKHFRHRCFCFFSPVVVDFLFAFCYFRCDIFGHCRCSYFFLLSSLYFPSFQYQLVSRDKNIEHFCHCCCCSVSCCC